MPPGSRKTLAAGLDALPPFAGPPVESFTCYGAWPGWSIVLTCCLMEPLGPDEVKDRTDCAEEGAVGEDGECHTNALQKLSI